MRTIASAFVFLLAACNTAEPMNTRTATSSSNNSEWRVEITSSGGIMGRGAGSRTVTSADGRADVARLVAAADPSKWRSLPPPPGSADMFEYTLTLTRGDEKTSVTWSGEDVEQLPADLGALFNAVWRP